MLQFAVFIPELLVADQSRYVVASVRKPYQSPWHVVYRLRNSLLTQEPIDDRDSCPETAEAVKEILSREDETNEGYQQDGENNRQWYYQILSSS